MPREGRFYGPDEGFGFEGTPKPKIQRDTYPENEALHVGRFDFDFNLVGRTPLRQDKNRGSN